MFLKIILSVSMLNLILTNRLFLYILTGINMYYKII